MARIHSSMLAQGIKDILELNIEIDWEFYQQTIINLIELSGWSLSNEVDFDILNSQRITLDDVNEWINNFVY